MPAERLPMNAAAVVRFRLAIAAIALMIIAGGCGDLTGPVSPSTPINVRASLVSPTSAVITWDPSPQNDGVVSYNVFRNGTKVGESTTTTYTDTGLAQQTEFKYTVSANCTSGVISDQSAESPQATVTTLDVTPPRVTAVVPVNGATGVSRAGTSLITLSEPIDPATLTTSTYNLKVTSTGELIPGTIVYNATARTAEFKSTFALPNASNITVTVTAGLKDLSGNAAVPFTSTFTTRDEIAPSVIATSPANGATGVSTTAAITITFNEAMDAATINATNITMRVTSSGTAVPGIVTYNTTTHVATFTPSSPLIQNVGYTVTVSGNVKDLAGNAMGVNFEFSFNTGDTTPPTVISTVPVNLATSVSVTSAVSATFSEAMDSTTISATTFTLRVTATSVAVIGTVTYAAATNTATFTPTAPLSPNTTYTARITTGAKDLAGNALATQVEWTFITGSAPDNTPPTVVSTSPVNGSTTSATTGPITITFSEAMDPATIDTTTFRLRVTATSAPVTGTVAYNTVTNTASFTPSSPLTNTTQYTATVTTGAKDLAGNALAGNFSFLFTVDTTAPTIVLPTSPVDGATNVPRNTTVSVTFSEAMNQSTFDPTTTFTVRPTATVTPIGGVITYNPATRIATFTPSALLLATTPYTVTITTGVKDLAGNALASNFTFGFTTAGP